VKSTLRPGLTGSLSWTVLIERTAPRLLPESPEFAALPQVLATGYLIGVLEWTCIRALTGHLDDGEATLGVHIDVSHDAPTPPGATVTVGAELKAVEGRVLLFEVEASDDAAVISRGTHRRAVIDLQRFEARLQARSTATGDT
jgi:fluoroacetyl-CoA thioesterase